jgi:hypothetical protein
VVYLAGFLAIAGGETRGHFAFGSDPGFFREKAAEISADSDVNAGRSSEVWMGRAGAADIGHAAGSDSYTECEWTDSCDEHAESLPIAPAAGANHRECSGADTA